MSLEYRCDKVYLFFFSGDPMPQVTWWRDNHLIDSSFEKTFSKTVQNTLSVPQVTREDLGATLTCQASNNNISAPASTRATVDLKCKINVVFSLSFCCPIHLVCFILISNMLPNFRFDIRFNIRFDIRLWNSFHVKPFRNY